MMKKLFSFLLVWALIGPASGNMPGTGVPLISENTSVTFAVLDHGLSSACATPCSIATNFGAGGNIGFAYAWALGGAGRSISTISIGGVAATLDQVTPTGNVTQSTVIASAAGVPGGAGNVVITWSGGASSTAVYGVYLLPNATAATSASTNAATTQINQSLNVNAGGAIISSYFVNTDSSTLDYNAGVVTDDRQTLRATARPGGVGSQAYPSAATPANITSTTIGSVTIISSTVAYNP